MTQAPAQTRRGTEEASGATPAIQLLGLGKRFGDVAAVQGLDLEIGDGEFFALLGPSGCGKSTALRLVAGLEAPSSGRILLHGEDMSGRPPERRDVSTVFQDYALFPHMSIVDNVAFPLRMKGERRRSARSRATEALELVSLRALADRRPDEVSGGQRQRAALARSLVWEPSALLLDEPLAALDFQLRQEMQEVLKELQRRVGITFLFVTHDQTEAFNLGDRVGVMRDGRLDQVGSPRELYYRPANLFVASFIGRVNRLRGTVAAVDSDCLTVRCGESLIRARLASDGGWRPAAGERAWVGVRPEFVEWAARSEPGAPARNRLPCAMRSVAFHGPVVETTVELGDGTAWSFAKMSTEQDAQDLEREICVTWDVEATWAFPADDGAERAAPQESEAARGNSDLAHSTSSAAAPGFNSIASATPGPSPSERQ